MPLQREKVEQNDHIISPSLRYTATAHGVWKHWRFETIPANSIRKNHHRRLVCTHYSHGDLEGTHSTFRVTILWMPPWEALPIGLGVEIIHHILWRASLQYTNIDIEWNRKCMQMHHVCSFSKPLKIHIYVGLLWGNFFRVDQKIWAPWLLSTWSAGLDAHVPWTPLNWRLSRKSALGENFTCAKIWPSLASQDRKGL